MNRPWMWEIRPRPQTRTLDRPLPSIVDVSRNADLQEQRFPYVRVHMARDVGK